jgi:hypothetical protein
MQYHVPQSFRFFFLLGIEFRVVNWGPLFLAPVKLLPADLTSSGIAALVNRSSTAFDRKELSGLSYDHFHRDDQWGESVH